MTDLSVAIVPKSDQLNADDLLAGPRTITVTRVTVHQGEQPVHIYFEGDDGKPYKPCKSMCRVLVHFWGKDGTQYAGRSMTLYRDPKVKFGGVAQGGIRISHLSHIDDDAQIALTETRGKRAPYQVRKLVARATPADDLRTAIPAAADLPALEALWGRLNELKDRRAVTPDEYKALKAAVATRRAELGPARGPGEEG